MQKLSHLAGRILVAQIFLMAGLNKLGAGYAGTQGYMESLGVPGALLPLVIVLEIGGAIALVAGWQTRIVSLLLAGFCIASAVIFHANLADQVTLIMFMKNFAIAGGLLILAAQDMRDTISIDNHLLARTQG